LTEAWNADELRLPDGIAFTIEADVTFLDDRTPR